MQVAAVGCALAHYQLEAPLGSGGMGIVFLGRDLHLCRPVAVKVLAADRLDHDSRRRLREEALTLSRLSHPNVAAVFDFGSDSGIDYLVMEFVPGTTLDVLLTHGPLAAREVTLLGAQLARGLEAAHTAGVIHRDVKPGNLRVTPDGLLKILDFGVATVASQGATSATTASGTGAIPALAGTIQYMAPERLRGMAASPTADIFSAGAVLYEMVCGQPAFYDTHPIRLIESILASRPPRPSAVNPKIDPRLECVILRALDKDPTRRYQRAADLAEALEALWARRAPSSRPTAATAVLRWAGRIAHGLVT
jgi:serine/threonine-protein kinase